MGALGAVPHRSGAIRTEKKVCYMFQCFYTSCFPGCSVYRPNAETELLRVYKHSGFFLQSLSFLQSGELCACACKMCGQKPATVTVLLSDFSADLRGFV